MASKTILRGQLRLILAITVVHIIAWYAFLSQLPLGLYPTPAERDILDTAFALANGGSIEGLTVTVYEFLLSIAARFVTTDSELVFLARSNNALALIATTAACAQAAGRYWKKNRAIWIAGLLIGMNPVLVFWAAEISPTLLAVLCFSLCFTRLLRWLRRPTWKGSLRIGLLLSIAVTFETSLISFVLIWPFVAWLYPYRNRTFHLGAALTFPLLALLFLSVSSLELQSTPGIELTNLGRGIYETFNSHEAYDGKSYGLHKKLNLFLSVNPLHWGLIFILALGGAYIRLKNGNKGNTIAALIICLALFAISYALNDGGSKARSLLYPILAIYAGGIIMMPKIWKHAGKTTKLKILAGLLLAAGLSYSDVYDARSHTNWESDYSFLARANLALESNQSAAEWAEKTLELNSNRDDMKSILLQAAFNEWAFSPTPSSIPIETARSYLEAARESDVDDPDTRAIEALYMYKLRMSEEAYEIWNEVSDQSALALVCLYWTGQVDQPASSEIEEYLDDPYYALLEKTVNINRNALAYGEGEEILDNMLAIAH